MVPAPSSSCRCSSCCCAGGSGGRRRGWSTAVVLIGPLNTLLKDVLRAGAARLRRGRRAAGLAELPERALVGHRHARHRRADPGLAAAGRPCAALGARRSASLLVLLVGLTRMWLGVHFLSDVVGGWALGVGWTLLTALLFGAFAEGRAVAAADVMTGLDQRIVLAPDDGSLGPLLRIADDRLAPGRGLRPARAPGRRRRRRRPRRVAAPPVGRRRRRSPPATSPCCGPAPGSTTTRWPGTTGRGSCSATCAAPSRPPHPAHEVHRGASGWVDLDRPDARLWLARIAPGDVRAGGPAGAARRGPASSSSSSPAGRSTRPGWRWSGSWTTPARPGPPTDERPSGPVRESGGHADQRRRPALRRLQRRRPHHRPAPSAAPAPRDRPAPAAHAGDWCSMRSPTCRSR